eukprot:CAMPEP_0180158500 /NCGR_PEP_ID=MMETSP0986-20121125/26941_1 /TAXON_ID=697907 /ORGANISM="non described non described, Strain CCMP2293" /LENGTH=243 /DNA_ID=CAMNT_0022108357 /DNA_START=228 /DNA_END=957 /DNA_ORIENTATION=+
MGGCVSSSSQTAIVAQPGAVPRPTQNGATTGDGANRPDHASSSKQANHAAPATNGAPAAAPDGCSASARGAGAAATGRASREPGVKRNVQEESAGPSGSAEVEAEAQQEEEPADEQEEGLSVVAAGPPALQLSEEAGQPSVAGAGPDAGPEAQTPSIIETPSNIHLQDGEVMGAHLPSDAPMGEDQPPPLNPEEPEPPNNPAGPPEAPEVVPGGAAEVAEEAQSDAPVEGGNAPAVEEAEQQA